MKFLLVALSLFLAVNGSSSLDLKFRFFNHTLANTKTIKHGGEDITSVIGELNYYDPTKGTLVIFHEYTFYEQSRAAKPLIESALDCSDYNVIYVDYTAYTRKDAKLTIEIVNEVWKIKII